MSFDELNALFFAPRAGMRVHRIGSIELPAGRFASADPLSLFESWKPDVTVAPGKYAVEVLSGTVAGWGERNAALRLVLAKGTPVRFERGGLIGVDAGLAAFYPPEMTDALAAGAKDNSILDLPVMRKPLLRDIVEWGNHAAAISSSGFGDGVYETAIGYDAAGSPVVALIDFGAAGEME